MDNILGKMAGAGVCVLGGGGVNVFARTNVVCVNLQVNAAPPPPAPARRPAPRGARLIVCARTYVVCVNLQVIVSLW